MKDRVYGSTNRDNTISEYSHREFTKMDCLEWLDKLEDESVSLWIIDPPYNVLTGNMTNKNGAAVFHSRYTAKKSPITFPSSSAPDSHTKCSSNP